MDRDVQKFAGSGYDASLPAVKYYYQVSEQYQKENFAWLEKEAAQIRKNKSVFTGGSWKIWNFYAGIKPQFNSAEENKKHLERLERWKRKYPKSITPRIAISNVWESIAFDARGSGYANTVSQEGREIFLANMAKQEKELLEAKNLTEKCPMWYFNMLGLAKWQDWEIEEFEALYQEAVAYEPNFYYFYREKGMNLLPRFGGRKGEWEDYLKQILREKGKIYYYLTLEHFVTEIGQIDFDKDVLPWKEAKEGFYELRKTFGAEKKRINQFAKFAFMANEFYVAQETFNEIGEDWDEGVWERKDLYDLYRRDTEAALR